VLNRRARRDQLGEQVAVAPCALAQVEAALRGVPRGRGKSRFAGRIEDPFDAAGELVGGADGSEIAVALMVDRIGNAARRERDEPGSRSRAPPG
jgi:hypothetical protein